MSVEIKEALLDLIVYACPTGELATQLNAFFARSRAEIGPNAAHRYPPHITLTGFFHDTPSSIPNYVTALREALAAAPRLAAIHVTGAMYEPHFYGLLIESPWLQNVTKAFAYLANSSTRADAIRLKDWLHLSLAYEFQPEQAKPLQAIARAMVDVTAPAGWELRLYERFGRDEWRCHASWPLALNHA
jgi:ubiquitin-associated SH3 domain-containing protein